jgi:hypothetical protein
VTTDPLTGAPAGYRYESYAGAEALVPVTWGLGGSPTKLGNGMCPQVSAYVAPGSTGLSGGLPLDIPYVGRPILMDVMCPASYARQTHPTVDALWFDSPFPVGTQEWPDGQVGQTVAAGWQTVTVFTSETSLRQRILASVRVVDHDSAGCPNEASSVPGAPVPARFTAQSLSVCMYGPNPYNRSESVPGGLTLSYSTVRGPAQASAYLAAVGDHPSASPVTKGCFQPAMTERVLIAVHGVQGSTHVTRWDDVVFMCGGGIHLGVGVPQQFAALDLSTVAPWAGDGSRAYVVGPWESTSPGVQTYFKGLMD